MDGYVYILTNKGMPGLVKLGWTSKDPRLRADELSTTGVPSPFVVYKCVRVPNPKHIESTLHAELDHCRFAQNREFFQIDAQESLNVLQSICAQDEACRQKKAMEAVTRKQEQERENAAYLARYRAKALSEETGKRYGRFLDDLRTNSAEGRWCTRYQHFRSLVSKLLDLLGGVCLVVFFVCLVLAEEQGFGIVVVGLLMILLIGVVALALAGIDTVLCRQIEKMEKTIAEVAEQRMVQLHGERWRVAPENLTVSLFPESWPAALGQYQRGQSNAMENGDSQRF